MVNMTSKLQLPVPLNTKNFSNIHNWTFCRSFNTTEMHLLRFCTVNSRSAGFAKLFGSFILRDRLKRRTLARTIISILIVCFKVFLKIGLDHFEQKWRKDCTLRYTIGWKKILQDWFTLVRALLFLRKL